MGEELLKEINIFAISTDPIYIGTGGYTIGRVDNTIVRDPITRLPKIPGSSLAGTWRYYMALKLMSEIKDKKPDFNSKECESHKNLEKKFENCEWKNEPKENWQKWKYNKIARITCAGQDESPNIKFDETPSKTGHCGRCIVCKAFGFSKKDKSSQGMLFFSDLHILFFPVYTRFGTKWITSKRILKENGLLKNGESEENNEEKVAIMLENPSDNNRNNKYINLGWLNLPYKEESINIETDKIKNLYQLPKKDIVIVPDQLLSHIINSNLEVRTSVSIDPITGAAKEGALFTSEAIPRGTIFSGNIRIFKRSSDNALPEIKLVCEALEDSKHFFETLGIGGMTTRGFGRLKIGSLNCKENENPASGGENGES